MDTLQILPFILFTVLIVTAVAERIRVPYPLLLVVAGLVVGFAPGIPSWHPPSDIVLPLFLPPILFAAARTISWRDTRNNLGAIFSLSILLVIVTTLFLAFILYWSIPKMPFESALVLGAIISPTDAVAATSVLSRMNVRQSIIRTIEVESLFNDATGIVLYKMALLFVLLGNVHPLALSWQALFMGAGGIAIGLLFSYFTSLIVDQFLKHSENNLPIIMSLILAYVAYLFAERIGASGVLAVVAAGLYHKKTERTTNPNTRLAETSVWETLIFFMNGIIFITIGIQFPSYLHKVNFLTPMELITCSLVTILALLGLRFLWAGCAIYTTEFFGRFRKNFKSSIIPAYKRILLVSWSGMRGLVSLALAVAIPLSLESGKEFPFRNLIIFLTILTILFTLLVQGLTLPWLVKKLKLGKDDLAELQKIEEIYQQLTDKAIQNIDQLEESTQHYSTAAKQIVEQYYANRRLHLATQTDTEATLTMRVEAENLLGKILQKEREMLTKLRVQGDISEEIYLKILRKLDRDEVGFVSYQ